MSVGALRPVFGLRLRKVVVACAAFASLAGCSSDNSRFDFPAYGSRTDKTVTSSVNPIPSEPVYAGGQVRPVHGDNAPYVPGDRTAVPRGNVERAALPDAQQAPHYNQQYTPPPPQVTRTHQPAPPQPKKPTGTQITVAKGDTLGSLARKHNTTVAAIQAANGMDDSKLDVGRTIIIPGPGSTPTIAQPKVQPRSHIVKSGESIYTIADKYEVDHRQLAQANNLAKPEKIKPGMVLQIPAKSKNGAETKVTNNTQPPAVKTVRPTPDDEKPGVQPVKFNPDSDVKSEKSKPQPKGQTDDDADDKPGAIAKLPQPEPMSGNDFRWPVRGRVISNFGPKPNGKHNDGINVAVPIGTSVKAAENGVVAYAGSELEGYGNLILIRHSNNWVSAYAHNEQLMVKRGDTVKRGQIIAKAGQSGSVNQPQLHFELRKGSKPVDPTQHLAGL